MDEDTLSKDHTGICAGLGTMAGTRSNLCVAVVQGLLTRTKQETSQTVRSVMNQFGTAEWNCNVKT